MPSDQQEYLDRAFWSVVGIVALVGGYVIYELFLRGEQPSAVVLWLGALAGTRALFIYWKVRRQKGIRMIGDDSPFEN